MKTLRLGILSTANIASTIFHGVAQLDNVTAVAVASRTIEKAETFAKRHGIPKTCEYPALIEDPDVDAVYIPLPTALAGAWAVRAAQAGKHVLVDKPFDSAKTVRAIVAAADEKGVVFMDGTHFVHTQRAKEVMRLIGAGRIGRVRGVVASFTVPLELAGDIRKDASLEPQGAIGDLGWYCARAAVAFLGTGTTRDIREVVCVGSRFGEGEVVNNARGVVVFDDGRTLDFDCAFDEIVMRQRVEVVGERGAMRWDGFVVPDEQWDTHTEEGEMKTDVNIDTKFEVETRRAKENGFPLPSGRETVVVKEGKWQAAGMVEEFKRVVDANDGEKRKKWAEEAVCAQRILDAMHDALVERLQK